MADDIVPDDVRDFIQKHIDSVAQLEALLLLWANPNEVWDATRTAKRLYTTEHEIAEVLARLCADGLLVCKDGVYRYECAPEMSQRVDRVANVYSRQLIAVTNMIHTKPRRIREFADAFKFRKDR
ncbi:MAG TPA: hypothetical protein VH934_07470 [Xanthobacteraceae bacterium]|jgi:two-component SAPR family response regulator